MSLTLPEIFSSKDKHMPVLETDATATSPERTKVDRIRLLLVSTVTKIGKEVGAQLAALEGVDHVVVAHAESDLVLKTVQDTGADILMVAVNDRTAETFGLIETLAQKLPALPLVVVTIEADDDAALQAVRLGAQECLDRADLSDPRATGTLRRIVERHRLARRQQEQETRQAVSAAASGVLDRLPLGVMILDGRGRILMTNSKARHIITVGDGLQIDPATGAFRAENADETKALLALVQRTLEGNLDADESCALTISRSSMKQALCLMVTPLTARSQETMHRRSGAAIFLSDPEEQVDIEEDVLRDLYGLTRVESSLALGLVQGKQLDELAKDSRVSVHTVRSQLKQIFRKTGANRQADVVKLLLTGPAAIRIVPNS